MDLVGGTLMPAARRSSRSPIRWTHSTLASNSPSLACAFINDVADLKYVVSFVPSNQSFRLRMTFAVPDDAPVGGGIATTPRRPQPDGPPGEPAEGRAHMLHHPVAQHAEQPQQPAATRRWAEPATAGARRPRWRPTVPPRHGNGVLT